VDFWLTSAIWLGAGVLTSSLTSATAKLTKSDTALSKHTALLPKLQTQLETLSSSHADSRKRKENEIAELRTALLARDEELATTKEESRNWRTQARALTRARAAEAQVAASVISTLRSEVSSVRVAELHAARLRILRLERQLADRSGQVDALGQYSAQIGEEADSLRHDLKDAEEERAWALAAWKSERDDRRSDKEWRQRTRSDQREILGLRDDFAFLSDLRNAERVIEDAVIWVGRERGNVLQAEKITLEGELEVAEGELDLAINEEIPRLETNLETMTQQADESAQRSEELQEALTTAEAGIRELQARAVEDRERFDGEIEEMGRKLVEKEKEVDKERSEKKRVAGLLGQSRAAQDGLREELDM
jgi:chromosome segregation ATPase